MRSRQARYAQRCGRFICDSDETVATALGPLPIGKHGKIEVFANGVILMPSTVYADDVVAFVCACVLNNPNIEKKYAVHVCAFVDAMDARAVNRHGYSRSPEERDFVWAIPPS
jgi:hypothetical protein